MYAATGYTNNNELWGAPAAIMRNDFTLRVSPKLIIF